METINNIWNFIIDNRTVSVITFAGLLVTVFVGMVSYRQGKKKEKADCQRHQELLDEIKKTQAQNAPDTLKNEVKTEVNRIRMPKTANEFFIKAYNAEIHENYDEAINYYCKAIEHNNDFAEAYNNIGLIYFTYKIDYKKARDYFMQAVIYKPDLVEPYVNLGNIYRKNDGDYRIAMQYYQKAIELNPNFAPAYGSIGLIYAECIKDYDTSIEYYKKAIALNPKDATAYYNIGGAYSDKHNYDKAIEYLKQAIKYKPDFKDAYHNLGIAYHHKGEFNIATECVIKAAQLGSIIDQQFLAENNISWKNL